jgi:hypothetical protein
MVTIYFSYYSYFINARKVENMYIKLKNNDKMAAILYLCKLGVTLKSFHLFQHTLKGI